MNIYFDTEFTGLHKNTSLISIGMIDEVGNSFYAELNDYDIGQVDSWIEKNVIKNLEFTSIDTIKYISEKSVRFKGNREQVREELTEWLKSYDKVQFVSDVCHYDFVLLIDLFGNVFKLPKNVCAACHDINQDIAEYLKISERDAFNYTRENFISQMIDKDGLSGGMKHNSLYDAVVIKHIYNVIKG